MQNKNLKLVKIEREPLEYFGKTQQEMAANLVKMMVESFNEQLEEYIKKQLVAAGFEFKSREEFHQFVKDRVTRVIHAQKPNFYEFYLDLGTEEQRLLGWYSDSIDLKYEGNKISAIIGSDFNKKKD